MTEAKQVEQAYKALQLCAAETSPVYRLMTLKSYLKNNKLLQDIIGLSVHYPFKCQTTQYNVNKVGTFAEAYKFARSKDNNFHKMPVQLQYLVLSSSRPSHIGLQARVIVSQLQLPTPTELAQTYLNDLQVSKKAVCPMCPTRLKDSSPICPECLLRLERATQYKVSDFSLTGYALSNFTVELNNFIVHYNKDMKTFTFSIKPHPTKSYSPKLPFSEYSTNSLSSF